MYPLDANKVDYTKCLEIHVEDQENVQISEEAKDSNASVAYSGDARNEYASIKNFLVRELGQELFQQCAEGGEFDKSKVSELFRKVRDGAEGSTDTTNIELDDRQMVIDDSLPFSVTDANNPDVADMSVVTIISNEEQSVNAEPMAFVTSPSLVSNKSTDSMLLSTASSAAAIHFTVPSTDSSTALVSGNSTSSLTVAFAAPLPVTSKGSAETISTALATETSTTSANTVIKIDPPASFATTALAVTADALPAPFTSRYHVGTLIPTPIEKSASSAVVSSDSLSMVSTVLSAVEQPKAKAVTQCSNAPSSSGRILLGVASSGINDVLWDGRITYKKRKAPKDNIPSAVSSTRYRQFTLRKEQEKKAKKKKVEEWECVYCKVCWSEDKNAKKDRQWINCDSCERKMHVTCVSKQNRRLIKFDEETEGDNFVCEACYKPT